MDAIEPIEHGPSVSDPRRDAAPLARIAVTAPGRTGTVPAEFDAVLVPDAFAFGGRFGVVEDGEPVLPPGESPGKPVLVDLDVSAAASTGTVSRGRRDLFPEPDARRASDPRVPFFPDLSEARPADEGAAASLGAHWGVLLQRLGRRGVAGARLLGLVHVGAGLRLPLLRALREAAPDAVLIADTATLPWQEVASFAGARLDGVLSSLAWWDGIAGWFEDELAMLRRVAPVFATVPETVGPEPFGIERAEQLLGLATMHGIGWIVPEALAGRLPVAELAGAAQRIAGAGAPRLLSPPGAAVTAVLRADHDDPRFSREATLLLLNTRADRPTSFDPAGVLPSTGGVFQPFAPFGGTADAVGGKLVPGRSITLQPGALLAFRASRLGDGTPLPLDEAAATAAGSWPRLAIEDPQPAVDGGAFAVKRTVGEVVEVGADVLCDGHDVLSAALQWKGPGDADWHEVPMRGLGNDRWAGSFPLEERGPHVYRVQGWRDEWATYRHELGAKHRAGVPTALELVEGTNWIRHAADRGHAEAKALLAQAEALEDDARRELFLSDETAAIMWRADDRPFGVFSNEIPVDAERTAAGFASWYEVFPRSMGDDVHRHGTFRDVEKHLPRIRDMGFDVLYFTPIHPIGRKNRKGPNNTLTPGPEDVGSPYAVGTTEGGHTAIHPELGTLEDFLHLRQAAEEHGLELALDFAVQCAPDHPWLAEHKGWFNWRPDGTVRYAENPPKKYQDIVNVDFYAADSRPALWIALAESVLFWCEKGIRLFRVDNPHTKPFPFWQWMIAEVRARYPDAVFLAEAFTKPKIMNRLAKIGFGQSYTYFTWRNTKAELIEYMGQLTIEHPKDYFRPHFFVNTPDINPSFLHGNERAAFLIRAALGATLSGLLGVYSSFELCEGTRLAPGKEEYLDSEKFQIRHWDWDRPGNIVREITRLNAIRRENPALRSQHNISFLTARNDAVLFYEKATPDRSNVLLIAVSMDPRNVQDAAIELPLWKWGLPDQASLRMEDLMSGTPFTFQGRDQRLRLTPEVPFIVWRATPA
ncbi:MAG: alpha-1,4-glucan--maltose-1-phosphate maltosyltransferase [Gluconacetobacter diazotrophicus]|nr:alpha-1,4-glucan--maltose-1-phosphate maltosyltransferase [Gluconacetobacter diazotrophicus]